MEKKDEEEEKERRGGQDCPGGDFLAGRGDGGGRVGVEAREKKVKV